MPSYRVRHVDIHESGNLVLEVHFWLQHEPTGDPVLAHQFIIDLPVGLKRRARRDALGRFLRLDGTPVEYDDLTSADHDGGLQIEDEPRAPNGFEYRDRIKEVIRTFIRTVLRPLAIRWFGGERGPQIRSEIAALGLQYIRKRETDPRNYLRQEVRDMVGTEGVQT